MNLTPEQEKFVELRVATARAQGKLEGEMGVTWETAMQNQPKVVAKALAGALIAALGPELAAEEPLAAIALTVLRPLIEKL